jgi:hypothetical protein
LTANRPDCTGEHPCGVLHTQEIKEYIREHGYLFWWIQDDAKERISLNLLVEAILHYGDGRDVRNLFELIGIERVAEIFQEQVSRRRIPYPKRTVHFFDLYFKKHVPSYSR